MIGDSFGGHKIFPVVISYCFAKIWALSQEDSPWPKEHFKIILDQSKSCQKFPLIEIKLKHNLLLPAMVSFSPLPSAVILQYWKPINKLLLLTTIIKFGISVRIQWAGWCRTAFNSLKWWLRFFLHKEFSYFLAKTNYLSLNQNPVGWISHRSQIICKHNSSCLKVLVCTRITFEYRKCTKGCCKVLPASALQTWHIHSISQKPSLLLPQALLCCENICNLIIYIFFLLVNISTLWKTRLKVLYFPECYPFLLRSLFDKSSLC